MGRQEDRLSPLLIHREKGALKGPKLPVGGMMIKADLARLVYETHGGISYREAKEVVETILKGMKQKLVDGENVKLTGFGSFNVIRRKARLGRNPQTGERIELAPSRYVSFKPSRLLDL